MDNLELEYWLGQLVADRNKIENRTLEKVIKETKSCFFEKMCKTDKPWARLRKKKTQTNKIINKRAYIKTDDTKWTRITRNDYG